MKLLKVKHQRDEAVSELEKIKEQHKVDDLLRNYVTTRDEYVQTEPRLAYPALPKQKKKEEIEDLDTNKTSKMLSMHSQLMKRYEKEVKQNMTNIETIANLNLTIADLEKRLREKTEEISGIERELKLLQIQVKSKARQKKVRGRSRSPEYSSSDEQDETTKLRKENKKLKKYIDKFKEELKGLDHGFFEEIEDIKYALQQAAKLNKIYEKTLWKMCQQFGVPYPHPEKMLER